MFDLQQGKSILKKRQKKKICMKGLKMAMI